MTEVLKSQGTRRFVSFCISIAVLVLIAIVSLYIEAAPTLVEAVTWPLVVVATGYLGFGMLHDGAVRKAIVGAVSAATSAAAPEKKDG